MSGSFKLSTDVLLMDLYVTNSVSIYVSDTAYPLTCTQHSKVQLAITSVWKV